MWREGLFSTLGSEPVCDRKRKELRQVRAMRAVLKMDQTTLEPYTDEAIDARRLIHDGIAAERTALPVFGEWVRGGFDIEPRKQRAHMFLPILLQAVNH